MCVSSHEFFFSSDNFDKLFRNDISRNPWKGTEIFLLELLMLGEKISFLFSKFIKNLLAYGA